MLKVAITGSLAAGKSATLEVLDKLGHKTISCDTIIHDLMKNNPTVIEKISQHFPQCIENGLIHRKKLAEVVFFNPEKLTFLENTLYPPLRQQLDIFFKQATSAGCLAIFVEIPLLFEKKQESFYDIIICIDAKISLRQQRFIARGGNKELFHRIDNQHMTPKQKAKMSNFSITNNGSTAALKKKIQDVLAKIKLLKLRLS